MSDRLTTRIGALALPNPVICSSSEPVITEAGIRAALAAGAARVIAKSVNERADAAARLDRADYAQLDAGGAPVRQGMSVFCRSGLVQRAPAEWFAALAPIDRDAKRNGCFVGASLVLASADGAVAIAEQARRAGLRVFELNVGAPHARKPHPAPLCRRPILSACANLSRACGPRRVAWRYG